MPERARKEAPATRRRKTAPPARPDKESATQAPALDQATLQEALAQNRQARRREQPECPSDIPGPESIEGRGRLQLIARGIRMPKASAQPHFKAVVAFLKQFTYTPVERELWREFRRWTRADDAAWPFVEKNAAAEKLAPCEYLYRDALKMLQVYCRKRNIPYPGGPAPWPVTAGSPPAGAGASAATSASSKAAHVPKVASPGRARPRLDTHGQRVWDGSCWHNVTSKQLDLLAVLFKAKGAWVCGKDLPSEPHKLCARMHSQVRKLIKTNLHDGYRIPALLAH